MGGQRNVRILHISDLHARGARDERRAWKRTQVLGDAWRHNLDELAADGRPFDLVVFTGDVADRGLAKEYAEVTPFVDELLKCLHVPLERFFVVPGNHDIQRKVRTTTWSKMRKEIRSAQQKVSEWMADPKKSPPFGFQDAWRDAVLERERAFWGWVGGELDRGELLPARSPHGRLGYRISLSLGDYPVHLIGLDSAWLAGDDADAGKLWLTEDQLGLLCLDGRGKPLPGFRLVLMHHPLSDLADADSATRLLADSTDLVLRGHQHTPVARTQHDPDHSFRELAAGCLYEGDKGNQYPNACQVIDAVLDSDGRPVCYEVRFRAWSPNGFWHDHGALYRETNDGRLTWHVVGDAVPGAPAHKPRPSSLPDTSPGPRLATPYRSMAQAPERFVERHQLAELVMRLEAAARSDESTSVAITTALRGSGGFGKTTLAQAVCFDERVQRAFPDGILWTTLGEHLTKTDRLGRVLDVVRWWSSEEVPAFTDVTAASAELRRRLSSRRVLLVVDDVWQSADLAPFLGLGSGAAVLVTTRDRRSLPAACEQIEVDAMRLDESRRVLGAGVNADPRGLARLAVRLGNWPLLLGLVNGQLRELARAHRLDLGEAIADVEGRLAAEGLTAFDIEDDSARQTAVERTLAVSLRRLDDADQKRYERLAVFPEDTDVPLSVLARYWRTDAAAMRKLCERLHALSLLQRLDLKSRTIRLHDVFRRYLIGRQGTRIATLHRDWLDSVRPASGRWPDLPKDEPHAWGFLAYHLRHAEQLDELAGLLFDFDWLDARLRTADVSGLLVDFTLLPSSHDAGHAAILVGDTLRLSSHVLARDDTQLPSQLIGRLGGLAHNHPRIAVLLAQARDVARYRWLRPVMASLTPPGGPLIRTLIGHADWIAAVAMTPDGKRAIAASHDRTLKLWDLEQGTELRTMLGHTHDVMAVAITQDATRAVSASKDCTLRLWDLEQGRELRTIPTFVDDVRAVAMTADGTRAVCGSWGRLMLWDLKRGKLRRTLSSPPAGVMAVAMTPNGMRAVAGLGNGMLTLWDLKRGMLLRTLSGHVSAVTAVAVTSNGKRALSASGDYALRLWDLDQGTELCVMSGHTSSVTGVAMTPDGLLAISASLDHTLKIWDLKRGKELRTLPGHEDPVTTVAMTPDGTRAVSGSWDRTVNVWDLERSTYLPTLAGHTDCIRGVAVTPDGTRAISASEDHSLKVWDLERGTELLTLTGHTDSVLCVAVTPDGTRALSGSDDMTLKLWDLRRGTELRSLTSHGSGIRAVTTTPDGTHAVFASSAGVLRLWNLEQGTEFQIPADDLDALVAVALTPDGTRVLSSSFDMILRIQDLRQGTQLRKLNGHWGQIMAVAVTRDGARAVSGSNDRTLKLWDLEKGTELRTLAGHTQAVMAVAIAPDGTRAVSASDDRSVVLWDLEAGQILARFTADGGVNACAVSPNGQVFVAGDTLGRIHILKLVEPPIASR